MVFGIFFLLTIIIIAIAVLFGMYLYFCWRNDTKMFIKPEHDTRLYEINNSIKVLEKEIKQLKTTADRLTTQIYETRLLKREEER